MKQRLSPDNEHWEMQIPKLDTFWRICVLPEILGRWYTRKTDLKSQISPRELGHQVIVTVDKAQMKEQLPVLILNAKCLHLTHLACVLIN